MAKLNGKPLDTCIIKLHIPTKELNEKEVEDMYEKTEQLLDVETKDKDHSVAQCVPGANICQKLPGTDRSGEARRAESGGWVLGEVAGWQPAPLHHLWVWGTL